MAKLLNSDFSNHVPEFISIDHWPSASTDLNPLDYKLWSVLEGMVCTRRHHNLESLKQVLVEAVTIFLWLSLIHRSMNSLIDFSALLRQMAVIFNTIL